MGDSGEGEERERGGERERDSERERKAGRSTMAWAQCTECSIYLQSPAERYGYVQRCRRAARGGLGEYQEEEIAAAGRKCQSSGQPVFFGASSVATPLARSSR